MSTKIKLIEDEIKFRHEVFVIVEEYCKEDFHIILDEIVRYSYHLGARYINITFRNIEIQKQEEIIQETGFTFSTDIIKYEKTIEQKIINDGEIRIKKLRPFLSELYIDIYNSCFERIQNARSITEDDIDEAIKDKSSSLGFFTMSSVPIGIFELGFKNSIPRIEAIGMLPEYRGRGIAGKCLYKLEEMIREHGYREYDLIVASSNSNAIRFYEKNGFHKRETVSRWYRAEIREEQERF